MKGSLIDYVVRGELDEVGTQVEITEALIADLEDALDILDNVYGKDNRLRFDLQMDIHRLKVHVKGL